MKYKTGDKFLVEITEINDSCYPYTLSEIGVITTEENLDKLRRPDDMTADEAWEIAREIVLETWNDGCGRAKLMGVFRTSDIMTIFKDNKDPHQVKVKIKAWEEKKDIKIGDVVKTKGSKKAVVLDMYNNMVALWTEEGEIVDWGRDEVEKTGKNLDVRGLLEQIREEE